jgi:plasmid stability protein
MISKETNEMAQLLVRNLETQLKVRLQKRAKRHGQSMEEEARDILRDALKQEDTPATGLGTEIAALFSESGLEKDIPELRGHLVTPATFES